MAICREAVVAQFRHGKPALALVEVAPILRFLTPMALNNKAQGSRTREPWETRSRINGTLKAFNTRVRRAMLVELLRSSLEFGGDIPRVREYANPGLWGVTPSELGKGATSKLARQACIFTVQATI